MEEAMCTLQTGRSSSTTRGGRKLERSTCPSGRLTLFLAERAVTRCSFSPTMRCLLQPCEPRSDGGLRASMGFRIGSGVVTRETTEKTSKFAKFGQNNEVNLRSCPQIG